MALAETSAERDTRVDTRLKLAAESGRFPKQLVVCGPAGTGKTFGILCFLHCLAADYPKLRMLWVRQTRVSLSESVQQTFEEEVLPLDGAERVADGPTRRFRHHYRYPNGSVIVLGGLDRPNKVMSTAWDVIYLNEAIETREESWDAMSSRLDRPGRPTWLGWLLADTNPGVPGHWIRRRADEGRLTLWNTTHKANPALWDGRDWTPAGRLYRDRLEQLRGAARARLLDGNWAANEGLVLGELLDCVVDELVEAGRKVGGIDFGWNHPFAALQGLLVDDVLWVVWERYLSLVTIPTHSAALPHGVEWWADPSRPESIVELQVAGHHVNPAVHYGHRPVQEGLDQVVHRARTGRLKIHRSCVNLIRECGCYSYDKDGKPADADNHACDALRYLVRGIDRGRAAVDRKVPATAAPAQAQAQTRPDLESLQALRARTRPAPERDPDDPRWW